MVTRQFWGQGLATEAGQASLRFAWEQIDADHVISVIRPDNVASQRVAERLGLTLQQTMTIRDREVLIFSRRRPTA
jgi:RimJ/RimL family protein N-acetyltransferase